MLDYVSKRYKPFSDGIPSILHRYNAITPCFHAHLVVDSILFCDLNWLEHGRGYIHLNLGEDDHKCTLHHCDILGPSTAALDLLPNQTNRSTEPLNRFWDQPDHEKLAYGCDQPGTTWFDIRPLLNIPYDGISSLHSKPPTKNRTLWQLHSKLGSNPAGLSLPFSRTSYVFFAEWSAIDISSKCREWQLSQRASGRFCVTAFPPKRSVPPYSGSYKRQPSTG